MICVFFRFLSGNPDFKFQFRKNMEFKHVSKPVPCYWLLENTGHNVQESVPELPTLPMPSTRTLTPHHVYKTEPQERLNVLMFCYFVILLYSLLTFCEHYLC